MNTADVLWNVLTTKRWELLKTMACQGPMGLRESARRGHRDAHALLDVGVLRRTDDGRIECPYGAVTVRGVSPDNVGTSVPAYGTGVAEAVGSGDHGLVSVSQW